MKRIVVLLLVLTLLIIQIPLAYASSVEEKLCDADIKLLYELGYTDELIAATEHEFLLLCVETYRTNPGDVISETTVLQIDNLTEIERFMSLSDAELTDMGADANRVKENREKLLNMLHMNDDVMMEQYHLSEIETRLIKAAITKGLTRNRCVAQTDDVFASGSITTSEMEFNTTAIDVSAGHNEDIFYVCNCSFAWLETFAIDLFDDKIAISWGGNLYEDDIEGNANYYTKRAYDSSHHYYDEFYGTKRMVLGDELTGSHMTMTFPQAYNKSSVLGNPSGFVKNGSISFSLSKQHEEGEITDLIARYGHRVLSVASVDFTWGWPGVTFSASYDQTPLTVGRANGIRY